MKKAFLFALPLLFVSQVASADIDTGTYNLHDNIGKKYGTTFGVVDYSKTHTGGYLSVSQRTTSAILQLGDTEARISAVLKDIRTGQHRNLVVAISDLQKTRDGIFATKVRGHYGGKLFDCSVKGPKGPCQFKLTKKKNDDLDLFVWLGDNKDLNYQDIDGKFKVTAVPEPSSMALFASGLAAMFGFRRYRNRAKK